MILTESELKGGVWNGRGEWGWGGNVIYSYFRSGYKIDMKVFDESVVVAFSCSMDDAWAGADGWDSIFLFDYFSFYL